MWGGRAGTKVVVHNYLQNGVYLVKSSAKIVKVGFHSFHSILDQNALHERTNRKCAQEFSNGKEWVLKC